MDERNELNEKVIKYEFEIPQRKELQISLENTRSSESRA